MKLLLDENLSDRIVAFILDFYPDSSHVKTLGLSRTDDSVVWSYAEKEGFTIVSKDSNFYQRSLVLGAPPKFIFLRVGNCPTTRVTDLLRGHLDLITEFSEDRSANILVLA